MTVFVMLWFGGFQFSLVWSIFLNLSWIQFGWAFLVCLWLVWFRSVWFGFFWSGCSEFELSWIWFGWVWFAYLDCSVLFRLGMILFGVRKILIFTKMENLVICGFLFRKQDSHEQIKVFLVNFIELLTFSQPELHHQTKTNFEIKISH